MLMEENASFTAARKDATDIKTDTTFQTSISHMQHLDSTPTYGDIYLENHQTPTMVDDPLLTPCCRHDAKKSARKKHDFTQWWRHFTFGGI